MSNAVYETTSVKIAAGKYRFNVSASKIKFDGFMSVYKDDEEGLKQAMLRESAAFNMTIAPAPFVMGIYCDGRKC